MMTSKKIIITNKNMREDVEEKQLNTEKLLAKYEKMRKDLIIMDDYDGGQAASLDMIIDDLRKSMWWTV
tara:strand:- start:1362 stop:1568 length:207 start_codon:yes stop_codon:yes gene_type:complete